MAYLLCNSQIISGKPNLETPAYLASDAKKYSIPLLSSTQNSPLEERNLIRGLRSCSVGLCTGILSHVSGFPDLTPMSIGLPRRVATHSLGKRVLLKTSAKAPSSCCIVCSTSCGKVSFVVLSDLLSLSWMYLEEEKGFLNVYYHFANMCASILLIQHCTYPTHPTLYQSRPG